MPIFRLPEDQIVFPDPSLAEEDGLIAIGGDLSVYRLVEAYSLGFFPWYNEGQEILWWHPKDRMVLFPEDLKIAKSMRPYFNQSKFQLSSNQCFEEVITACAEVERKDQEGTWISPDMKEAYIKLNELGIAHSIEVFEGNELVGGLYGIALGRIFFGESMFARRKNASKFAFISLVRILKEKNFMLVDCQQETDHLASLGARTIKQEEFVNYLAENRLSIEQTRRIRLEEDLFG